MNTVSAISAFAPGLYIVATPIGNLADIGTRAIELLQAADVILCEDTRVTGKLTARHGITTQRVRCDERATARVIPKVLERLAAGDRIALVSDAGTPLVSDPGSRVVLAASEAGHRVSVIPGPSAAVAAWSVSGFSGGFAVLGFLPRTRSQKAKLLAGLMETKLGLVFFDSAHRIATSALVIAEIDPERPLVIARELTKRFEQTLRGSAAELSESLSATSLKGEITLVIGPPDKKKKR